MVFTILIISVILKLSVCDTDNVIKVDLMRDGCIECRRVTRVTYENDDSVNSPFKLESFLFLVHCFHDDATGRILSFKHMCLNPRQRLFKRQIFIRSQQSKKQHSSTKLFHQDLNHSTSSFEGYQHTIKTVIAIPRICYNYISKKVSELFSAKYISSVCLECGKHNQYVSSSPNRVTELERFITIVLGSTTERNSKSSMCQIRLVENKTEHVVQSDISVTGKQTTESQVSPNTRQGNVEEDIEDEDDDDNESYEFTVHTTSSIDNTQPDWKSSLRDKIFNFFSFTNNKTETHKNDTNETLVEIDTAMNTPKSITKTNGEQTTASSIASIIEGRKSMTKTTQTTTINAEEIVTTSTSPMIEEQTATTTQSTTTVTNVEKPMTTRMPTTATTKLLPMTTSKTTGTEATATTTTSTTTTVTTTTATTPIAVHEPRTTPVSVIPNKLEVVSKRNTRMLKISYEAWDIWFRSILKLTSKNPIRSTNKTGIGKHDASRKNVNSKILSSVVKSQTFSEWYARFILVLNLRCRNPSVISSAKADAGESTIAKNTVVLHSFPAISLLTDDLNYTNLQQGFKSKFQYKRAAMWIKYRRRRKYGGEVADNYFILLFFAYLIAALKRNRSSSNLLQALKPDDEFEPPKTTLIDMKKIEFEWIVGVVELSNVDLNTVV